MLKSLPSLSQNPAGVSEMTNLFESLDQTIGRIKAVSELMDKQQVAARDKTRKNMLVVKDILKMTAEIASKLEENDND